MVAAGPHRYFWYVLPRVHSFRALVTAICLSALGHAQSAPARSSALGVGRADAIRWGSARGPGVRVARAPLPSIQDARASTTRLTHAPLLTITGGHRRGIDSNGPELGVSVTQDIPLGNVGSRRSELVSAWGEQSRRELQHAEIEAAARAAVAWSMCLEAEAIERLRLQAVAQAERIEQLSRVRVAAGTGFPSDEALARSDTAAARAAVLDAEGAVVEAYAELRLAIGQPPDQKLVAVGDLDDAAGAVSEPLALAGPARSLPAVVSAQARAELARAQTRLTSAVLGPSVVVGAAYVREGGGTQVITGFVGLPLPLVTPGAFDTARERALEQRAQADVREIRNETEKNVSLAAHDRLHWREVRDGLLPGVEAAREALRITLANFEAGTLDIAPVLVARQRVIVIEEQLAHVTAEVLRADIRLSTITGRILEGVR